MHTISTSILGSKAPADIGENFVLPQEIEKAGLWATIRYFFARDAAVNFLMISAIVIGFFQGWLKYRFRYQIVTFAFDIPLVLALGVTCLSVKRGQRLFPDCNMGKVLIALTVVGLVYAVLPNGIPWVVSLSAFRGWCFIPLMFLVGFHCTRSVRQVEVYLWLLVLLGVIVAFYGVFLQSESEIRAMMDADPELRFRLENQWYVDSTGRGVFRRFSTFVSSAAFGGMMAYCSTFAISRLAHPGCSWWERSFLIGAALLMSYAAVLSGSRSTLLGLLVGAAFAIWYRRSIWVMIVIPLALVLGLGVGMVFGGASGVERFTTLLDIGVLWSRLAIVFQPALECLLERPLGAGLGASGHGVPVIFALELATRNAIVRIIDGDLGQLAVEMGIVGIFLFVALVGVGLSDALRWMNKLRGSPMGIIGLPAGSMFILASLQLFYGSPFLGIPGGALLWFFLGSMCRLVEDYDKLVAVAGAAVADVSAQFVSFISSKRLTPLYTQPPKGSRTSDQTPLLHGSSSWSAQRTLSGPGASGNTAVATHPKFTQTPPSTRGSAAASVSAPAGTSTRVAAGPARADPSKRFLFRRPSDSPDRRPPRRKS